MARLLNSHTTFCFIPRALFLLSDDGRLALTISSFPLQGWYEIVSLSGHVSRSLNLSHGSGYRVAITLAAKNDSLFGGYVSGPLIAATNVQIVLWKFTSPSEGEASVRDSSSTPVTKMEVP
ncbi:hypothetical protein HRI_002291500 [Hibiscus trionum]|uniref:AT-hook motif nuclear-localized protein n=1 Tax=Hibiscus trionum TaxID=183268 RepID=A0A9W7M1N8_HIBTR|nr:hypothetical protein HRI_002291500 [Hibiscus trionum]